MGRKYSRTVRARVWPRGLPLLGTLSADMGRAMVDSGGYELLAESLAGKGSTRGVAETGVRRVRLVLRGLRLAAADFAGNDDGRGAPELFVKVRKNGKIALNTTRRFAQDQFAVVYSTPRPAFDLVMTGADVLRIEVWDKDLMNHDQLVAWIVKLKHIGRPGSPLKLTSQGGTVVEFATRPLK